jgi:hypothetical protein
MGDTAGSFMLRRDTKFHTLFRIAFYATFIAAFARAFLIIFVILHVRNEIRYHSNSWRKYMTQFLHNALGLAVALATGGLMFAVALV